MTTVQPSQQQSTGIEADAGGIPWRSSTVIAILATSLMTPMDVPLISPVLPEIQTVFGISQAQAGHLITVYALPGIVLGPLIGMLADRLGRKRVLVGCLVLYGVAGSAIALTSTFAVAVGLRFLQGCAAGVVLSTLAMTLVGDHFHGRQHGAMMGTTTATLAVGAAIYPAIGGFLSSYAWNAPFALYGVSLIVALFVALRLDDSPTGNDTGEDAYFRNAVEALPTGEMFQLYGIVFLTYTLLFGAIYTILPFYLRATFGYDPIHVGLVTSAILLLAAFVATQNGRLGTHASTKSRLAGGFGLYTVGLLGLGSATTPVVAVIALLLFGIGSGLVTPTLFTAISELAPDRYRAGVMSVRTTTLGAGQAVGPAVFTAATALTSYGTVLVSASAATALGAIGIASFLSFGGGQHG